METFLTALVDVSIFCAIIIVAYTSYMALMWLLVQGISRIIK